MIFPSLIMSVRREMSGRRRLPVWIPLVLLWAPLVLLWIILLPAILLLAAAFWRGGRGKVILLLAPRLFGVFCRLRGTALDIENADRKIGVRFW